MKEEYLVTVHDGVMRICPACDDLRKVYIQTTEQAEVIMACCFCQRIIRRISFKETT